MALCLEDKMRMEFIHMDGVRSFDRRDFLRITDFNRDEIMYLLEVGRLVAQDMRANRDDTSKSLFANLARGKRGATTFFEASTRTHDSSLVAMTNLGIPNPIQRRSTEGTSQAKSEALAHDLGMYSTYGTHVIVMRHPCEGAPQWAADYIDRQAKLRDKVRSRIINGGDGAHSHVTQGLLDMLGYYLLYFVGVDGSSLRRGLSYDNVMSGLTLYGIGDSLKGRTIKDNARGFAKFPGNRLVLVGPEEIRMPADDIKDLERSGLEVVVLDDIPAALEHSKSVDMPIFYFMRTQEERLLPQVVEIVRGKVDMTPEMMEKAGLMVHEDQDSRKIVPFFHPLPMHKRHREIHPSFETTPHFRCFDEAEMGPFMRTAIIGLSLGVIGTSAAKPYVDPRIKGDYPKYVPVELSERLQCEENMFSTLAEIVRGDFGSRLFEGFIEKVRCGATPYSALDEMLQKISADESIRKKYRHFTFRFIKGESGTVIDHIENGLTGLIKYQLDLSRMIGRQGCDGKPIVVSAVDGLDSSKRGIKGAIKVRGVLLPPESLHYCYLLSPDITMTHIADGVPVGKFAPLIPEVLENFIRCKNPLCISSEDFSEKVPTIFYRDRGDSYRCRYCDTVMQRADIRKYLIRGG
ncbi:aspartate carbamoyltransferase regulatory subunit [archaeon]|nr:aspartate carbamoyltransferase regulatory subunit [archaeon]